MEIEASKIQLSQTRKRKHNQLIQDFETIFGLNTKKVKLVLKEKETYHLNNLEKSFIYLHGAIGSESKKIASSLGRDTRSINAFLQNAKDSTQAFSPKNNKKGRWVKGSSKLDKRHKEFLARWIDSGVLVSARDAYLRLNSIKSLKPISYNPVRKYLQSLGQFVKAALKSDVSEKNKSARLKYCRKYQNFNFQKVLFSDETIFQLNTQYQKVFHVRGKKIPKKTKFNPNSKIMVWGGISFYGKTSLFIVNDTMGSEEYLNLLKKRRREILDIFKKRKIWCFQQDGAPSHRPKKVKNYIKRWLTKRLLPHPPQSPDLNPIELVWAQMKKMVEKKRPQSRNELLRAIQSSWTEISLEYIRKCINNISNKMEKIIECNGDLP